MNAGRNAGRNAGGTADRNVGVTMRECRRYDAGMSALRCGKVDGTMRECRQRRFHLNVSSAILPPYGDPLTRHPENAIRNP